MADRVGKIVFEGEFDAGDLADEIRREVVAELLPLLKDIQKEAAKTARALDGIDGHEMAAAADQADHLADELNDVTRAALAAEAATDRHSKALAKESDLTRALTLAESKFKKAVKEHGQISEQSAAAYRALNQARRRYADALADSEEKFRATQVANRKLADQALKEQRKQAAEFLAAEAKKRAEAEKTAAAVQATETKKRAESAKTAAQIQADAEKAARAHRKASKDRDRKGFGIGGLRLGDDESFIGNRLSGGIGSVNKSISRFIGKVLLLPVALSAAIPAMGVLGAAIGQLTVSALAVAPAAGAAFASLASGFAGLSEGAEAFNKEMFKDVDEARFKEIGNLMSGLLTSWHDAMASTQLQFAQELVPTFTGMGKLITELTPAMKGINTAATTGINQWSAALGQMSPQLQEIARSSGQFIREVTPGGIALTKTFVDIGAASSRVVPQIGRAFNSVFTEISKGLETTLSDGSFQRVAANTVPIIEALGRAMGTLIVDVVHLADVVGPSFAPLIDAISEMAHSLVPTMASSAKEFLQLVTRLVPKLGEFLQSLGPVIEAVLPKIEVLASSAMDLLVDLAPSVANILVALLPLFTQLVEAALAVAEPIASLLESLTAIPGLVQAIAVGFLAWKVASATILPISKAIDAMSVNLTKMPTGIKGIKSALAQSIGNNKGTIGSLLVGGGAAAIQSDNIAAEIGGALASVAGGALAGSAFGPIGTAVGAAVGGGIAGISFLLRENAEAAKIAADAQAEYAAAVERSNAATLEMQGSQKSFTDALIASGGAIDPATIGAVGDQIGSLPDSLLGRLDKDTVKQVSDALKNLSLTQDQLATQVTGSQTVFDSLVANLQKMGPAGQIAARELAGIRQSVLDAANVGATANPLLSQLATTMGVDLAQAAANVTSAFRAVPQNIELTESMPAVQGVIDILRQAGAQIDVVNGKPVIVNVEDQQVQEMFRQLEALGVKITTLPTGEIKVALDQPSLQTAIGEMQSFVDRFAQIIIHPTVSTPGQTAGPNSPIFAGPFGGGRAGGGMLPGFSPGVDNMMVPMSGGEGVIIPEAMRALGPDWLYNLNRHYRPNISRRGYADGGVVPGGDPVIDLLTQIRDLLAGKAGGVGAPLNAIQNNTDTTATALEAATGAGGAQMGPFGTPLKPKGDPLFRFMEGALKALGADPAEWIGTDPTLAALGAGGGGGPGGIGIVDNSMLAQLLKEFAQTRQLGPDLQAMGLTASSPVINAINSAASRKKNPLGQDQIAGLIDQILQGGGFAGTLDAGNKTLVAELDKLRKRQLRDAGATSRQAAVGGLPMGPSIGTPAQASDAAALIAFAQQTSGGAYKWGASDLASGLSDCSGAVSDLVELITKGKAGPERLFSTANAADVLSQLGAVQGAVPGALQIGWSPEHMRATLPNGVAFESGGGTGQGATFGGNAQGAAGMPNIMSLGVGGIIPAGMTSAFSPSLGGGAGVQNVFVVNMPGAGGGMLGGMTPGQAQGMLNIAQPIIGAGTTAAGGVAADVATDVISSAMSVGLEDWTKRQPSATNQQLVKERNPLAIASMAGFDVQDFSRFGGGGGEVMKPEGPPTDAKGRMFSDTEALMDRTMTDLQAQLSAMREQLLDVLNQIRQYVSKNALEPVVEQGVKSAIEGLSSTVTSSIGQAIGQAAAPEIAAAVKSAMPEGDTGGLGALPVAAAKGLIPGMAGGGTIRGGIPGRDSVPILGMPGEHMLSVRDVAAMGGQAGVYAFRQALHRNGGIRHMATGGGVVVNDVVGAEFFGVSQIPIIGMIVNLLVRVLLSILGVEIEARDTLDEMSKDVRQFRGEFERFDAAGRLISDTSGLIDRSQTSEQAVADERIRILKIVIQALIKYIIEKVIVPIAKAVANAAIQAGASAVGGGVNSVAPGAGGIAEGAISALGQAGVDIVAEIGTDFGLALTEVGTDALFQGAQDLLPGVMTGIFSGAAVEQWFGDPLSKLLGGILGGFLGLFSIGVAGASMGGGFGGLGGGLFDGGGLATGIGLMPKATMDPELVLSPEETKTMPRLVNALEKLVANGGVGRTLNTGDIHLHGPDPVRDAHAKLMTLLGG